MFVALQICSVLSVIGEPFLPFASKKLKGILNYNSHNATWDWDTVYSGDILINSGVKINKSELLFEKIEDSEIEYQLEKLNNSKLA